MKSTAIGKQKETDGERKREKLTSCWKDEWKAEEQDGGTSASYVSLLCWKLEVGAGARYLSLAA